MDYNTKCGQIKRTCGQTRIENKLQNIIFGGEIPLFIQLYIYKKKQSQTQHFIESKIILLAWSRYMFQSIPGPSSGKTNRKYANKINN
jgi:hypothetical protein